MNDPQQSWWFWLGVLGFFVVLWLLYLGLKALERRGIGPKAHHVDRVGSAMLEVQSIFDPGKRQVIEARQEKKAEEEGEGEPPTTEDRRDS